MRKRLEGKRFERELAAWEAGATEVSRLEACYPGRDVEGITDLHSRLAVLQEEDVPNPGASWAALQSRLPQRIISGAGSRRMSRRRLAVALVAVFLALPALAYAARLEPVRDGLSRVVKTVARLMEGPHSPSPPTPAPPPGDSQGGREDEQRDESSLGANPDGDRDLRRPDQRRGDDSKSDDDRDEGGNREDDDDRDEAGDRETTRQEHSDGDGGETPEEAPEEAPEETDDDRSGTDSDDRDDGRETDDETDGPDLRTEGEQTREDDD